MKAQKVWFENGHICIITADGREGNLPMRLFPRLYKTSEKELQSFTLSHFGIHWKKWDEDLSYEGFFSQENTSRNKND